MSDSESGAPAPGRNGVASAADPYVAEYAGVCGGYPVIRETRIPVRLVIQFTRDGASIDELATMWPTVTAAQIQGALDYYAQRPQRVDEDIARNEREPEQQDDTLLWLVALPG